LKTSKPTISRILKQFGLTKEQSNLLGWKRYILCCTLGLANTTFFKERRQSLER